MAANCKKRTGIESRTGGTLVFSALPGFRMFSPVAWRTHRNSDVPRIEIGKAFTCANFIAPRIPPALGFDVVLFFSFFIYFLRFDITISFRKKTSVDVTNVTNGLLAKIFCIGINWHFFEAKFQVLISIGKLIFSLSIFM